MSLISMPGPGWRRALCCVVAFAALGACGGGTAQYEPFVAQRVISFGDESSAFKDEVGRKYTVNVLDDDGNIDCRNYPIWIQAVASLYGFDFEQCSPPVEAGGVQPALQAFTYAEPLAVADDLPAQIATAERVGGSLREKDLITVLLGSNDVRLFYLEVAAGRMSEDDALNELRARAERLANQINAIVEQGARALVATVPDLGYSPFAQKQDLLRPGDAALLSRLTVAFNEQLGVSIVLDGSLVGLVQGDQMVQAMVDSPGSFGLTNSRDPVCVDTADVNTPDCTTDTVVEGADPATYLWASNTLMSFGGHSYLGQLAQGRARDNPF